MLHYSAFESVSFLFPTMKGRCHVQPHRLKTRSQDREGVKNADHFRSPSRDATVQFSSVLCPFSEDQDQDRLDKVRTEPGPGLDQYKWFNMVLVQFKPVRTILNRLYFAGVLECAVRAQGAVVVVAIVHSELRKNILAIGPRPVSIRDRV